MIVKRQNGRQYPRTANRLSLEGWCGGICAYIAVLSYTSGSSESPDRRRHQNSYVCERNEEALGPVCNRQEHKISSFSSPSAMKPGLFNAGGACERHGQLRNSLGARNLRRAWHVSGAMGVCGSAECTRGEYERDLYSRHPSWWRRGCWVGTGTRTFTQRIRRLS